MVLTLGDSQRECSKSIYCAFVLTCMCVCKRERGILIVTINIVSCLLYLKDFMIIMNMIRGKSNLIQCWSLQIPHLRPAEYKRSRLPRNRRTVNRAYGGVLSGGAVRER